MAKTNAELQAAWRARRKEEMVKLRAQLDEVAWPKAAPAEENKPRVLPAQLPPGVTKARKNQYVEGATARPKLARQVVPDLEEAKKAFAARMRDARIAAGLTQADVAFALFGQDLDGTYRKRYINWEIGRSFMTQNVIPVFARLTGTDCNFLFGSEPPSQ